MLSDESFSGKITQPLIFNIVTGTSTTLYGITIYVGLVGQPYIYIALDFSILNMQDFFYIKLYVT